MQRLCLRILRSASTKIVKQSQPVTQISHTQKLSILTAITEKMKLRLKPSIIITDEINVKKKLSQEEKIQLGLFIPKSPFNPRLSRSLEQQYISKITNELYHHQLTTLQTHIRILQNNLFLQSAETTLDHYINIIYKDIYARYLISKNIGIEWHGYFANTGVTNGHTTAEYNYQAKFRENYSILLDFIQTSVHLIQESETIGLYSYYQKKFVNPNIAGVEKIKRLGHYIKSELTEFGKYEHQFRVLQEKNSKVYLLIQVEKLEKLINPNAICINSEDKFIMLKKSTPQTQVGIEYLILSLDTFKKHQKYFKDSKYEKHNTFDGKYLLGMKCLNVPIISEIQGYSRLPNAYLVNQHCHVGDFERVIAYQLPHSPPFIDDQGIIKLKRSNDVLMLEKIKVNDEFKKSQKEKKHFNESYVIVDEQLSFNMLDKFKIEKSLQKVFIEEGIHFMDFHDVLDDEVYYHQTTKQVLHFKMGKKYSITIPEQNIKEILKGFNKEKTIISESKIKIESINTGKKPREKRQFRKQRKQKLQQITQHYSLVDALSQIESISISSLSPNVFVVPIFVKKAQIVPYESILNQEQIQLLLEGKFNEINLENKTVEGVECKIIYANEQLLKALIYLRNLYKSKDIHNVIIEPQSQTEQLIPNALHLNYLINRSKARGRKTHSEVKNNISLIKLHPTLAEDVRSLSIKQLIMGVIKSNDKQQYGFGLEALRLWTASNDSYLGDRSISDHSVNKQLEHSQHIRTVFWNLLSILPHQIQQVKPQLYLSNFILDCIDCYIANMDECYKTMNINQAYLLTNDFFCNILNEIYVKNIKERIIAFPNLKENEEHFFVIRRILELVAVVSPLFPFTAYHISRKADLVWPSILNPKFYERIPLHTQMIKTRVRLINKLRLNRLQHAQISIQSLKQSFSAHDLQLFFNVKKVNFHKPDIEDRACSLQMRKNNSITNEEKIFIYSSDDYCIRCEPKSKQTEHLCPSCIDYLEEQIQQPLIFFNKEQRHQLV